MKSMIIKDFKFSDQNPNTSGKYRYLISWERKCLISGGATLVVLMQNPNTSDDNFNNLDHSSEQLLGHATKGYNKIIIVNTVPIRKKFLDNWYPSQETINAYEENIAVIKATISSLTCPFDFLIATGKIIPGFNDHSYLEIMNIIEGYPRKNYVSHLLNSDYGAHLSREKVKNMSSLTQVQKKDDKWHLKR